MDYSDLFAKDVNEFNLLLDNVGLMQVILNPTGISQTTSSIIDLMLIPRDINVINSGTLPGPKVSDHEFIFCDLLIPHYKNQIKFIEYRDIKSIDIIQFQYDLQSIPWRNIYDIQGIDDKVSFFTDNIRALMD